MATATATATATGARARAHTPTVCPERPPVAPAGSRRPPQHPDHGSRTTASPARPMTGGYGLGGDHRPAERAGFGDPRPAEDERRGGP
ncbi:hypothetical protein ACFWQE_38420, partial [Streptomyces bacillaris]